MLKIQSFLLESLILFFVLFLIGCGNVVELTTATEEGTTTSTTSPSMTTSTTTTTSSSTTSSSTTSSTSTTSTTINPPAAPTGLTASGSLNRITLTWQASSSEGVTGYNIYRSTDEANFSKTADSPIAATAYNDAIASPGGDGIPYYYKVTALGSGESSYSAAVKNLHGTRLSANNPAGFTTVIANSPYVAEGAVTIEGGSLTVAANTKLYVPNNSIIDIEQSYNLTTNGLLRVVASTGATATFTSHKVGGTLANNEGLGFIFNGAANYNPVDNSGTLLQNSSIINIRASDSVLITDCSPKFYNSKFTSNSNTGGVYIRVSTSTDAIIQNCAINKAVLQIVADQRARSFKVDHNSFRNGYYSIGFNNLNNPGVNSGQIELNDFDGTKTAYLYNMTGASAVPLGNNYWFGGIGSPPKPSVTKGGNTTIDFNFDTALSSAPANVGPNW